MPTTNDAPSIQGMVINDLEVRLAVGIQRYGTPLQPHNGRDGLRDLYEELLDACCYVRQVIEERSTMDFSHALGSLKDGKRVGRSGWNGKGMWIALSPVTVLSAGLVFAETIRDEIGEGQGVFRPYLMMRTVDGEFVPWVASQSDLLAEDWEVVSPDAD